MNLRLLALRSDVAAAKDQIATLAVEVMPRLLAPGTDAAEALAIYERPQSAYDEYQRLRGLLELAKTAAGDLAVVAS